MLTSETLHSPLTVLVCILLLDLLAFTLILPLFPALIDHFSRLQKTNPDPVFAVFDSTARALQKFLDVPSLERHNSVFFGGILGSLFSLLQFLSSPFFGALSDSYGRKSLLLVAILGSLGSYFLWSISGPSFSLFLLSRVVGGLSKASVSVAIAIVTDLLPAERRGRGMALVGASFSLAFLLGPSVGAYFSVGARASAEFDPTPARLAMALTGIELALLLFLLPETLPARNKETIPASSVDPDLVRPPLHCVLCPRSLFRFDFLSSSSPSASDSFRVPLLRSFSRVYFLFLLLFSAMEFTLGFLTHIRFAYTSAQQGRLYLFSGFCMLVIQGAVVRRVPSTFEAQSAGTLVGLSSIVPSFLIIAFAQCQTALFIGLFLYSIASATVVPFMTTLFSHQCDPAQKGACLGAFRSIGALARACGPLLGSLLFWLLGPTLGYAIGAFGLIMPVILFWRIRETELKKNKNE